MKRILFVLCVLGLMWWFTTDPAPSTSPSLIDQLNTWMQQHTPRPHN